MRQYADLNVVGNRLCGFSDCYVMLYLMLNERAHDSRTPLEVRVFLSGFLDGLRRSNGERMIGYGNALMANVDKVVQCAPLRCAMPKDTVMQ